MTDFVRPIIYSGIDVDLGPIHPEHDLPFLWKWINDPEVAKYTLATWPTHYYAEKDYIENLHKRPNDDLFAIQTKDGTFIGMMGLHNINGVHGTASTGALIGPAEYRNKKLGRDAKMLVLYHAFYIKNLRKVCSSVKAYNPRSKRYLEATGYEADGGPRKNMFYYDGEYHDEYYLCIYREKFIPLWEEYKAKLETVIE